MFVHCSKRLPECLEMARIEDKLGGGGGGQVVNDDII
jgi:hypothetical protein